MQPVNSTNEQKDPRQLETVLKETSLLANLVHKTRLHQAFEKIIHAHLPPTLRLFCHVVNFRENILIVGTTGAHWATELRFLTPTLLSALREHHPEIQKIQIRITA